MLGHLFPHISRKLSKISEKKETTIGKCTVSAFFEFFLHFLGLPKLCIFKLMFSNDCLPQDDYLFLTFVLSISVYFFTVLFSIVSIIAIFCLAFKIDRNRQKTANNTPMELLTFMFKERFSYELMHYAKRFALTSFVYVICSFPICILQYYLILKGPLPTGMVIAYRVYNILSPSIVAFINITAYGLFSRIFKEEVKLVMRKLSLSVPFAKPDHEFEPITAESSCDESTILL